MIYGSICSGIEAASVAWRPLGWRAAFVSEIDKFPRAVLKHHYPYVPLHGDFTTIQAGDYAAIDVLVGGTPCQSFSLAGLRGGLADERGNLALEYLRLAGRLRPKWLVWENVPGVLSSNGGRDFGSILGGLVELGYGFAYRVLDAQYIRVDGFGRAVPQRRRRVFVVGYLGDWRRAAAVLFERESLQGHPAPRRQKGKGIAHDVAPSLVSSGRGVERSGETRGQDPVVAVDVAPTLLARGNRTGGARPPGTDVETCDSLVARCVTARNQRIDFETETFVAHALRADGFDASEDGTGRGTPLIAFSCKDHGADAMQGVSPTMRAMNFTESHANAGGQLAVAFDARQSDVIEYGDKTGPLDTDGSTMGILTGCRVRRLMPVECERLQGFPEVRKSVTVSVWPSIDQAETAARAGAQNLKLPKYALSAAENASGPSVNAADGSLSTGHQSRAPRVVVSVRIDCERRQVTIVRTGRLIWSASTAEKPAESPLLMPVEDFVQLVANMLTRLAPTTHAGKAGLRANINDSSDHLNGSASVHLSGGEIAGNAGDAEKFTTGVAACMKFTTSEVGRNFQISEQIWRTWCSCVVRAIGSCIPDETRKASSFDVRIELTHGYTAIPYRGKIAADGPRYKALGNSMAVNCMRWLGRRIAMVTD